MTWPPSAGQQAAAEAYVADMAQRLGLGAWRAEVAPWYVNGPDPENSDAETFVATYTDRFTVHLYQAWWNAEPEEQRRIVVHELLHPHLDRGWTDVLDAAADSLGDPGRQAMHTRTRQELERVIERLAWAISEFYPLPALPKR